MSPYRAGTLALVPDPDPFPTKKAFTINGGMYEKQATHICPSPKQADLPTGVKLEEGDMWTCQCGKKHYAKTYVGTVYWSTVEP